MLKLLIADDERIIRETISRLIDWESLGVTLIGLAKDGSEAYNIILDECPDIVLTDIKMPGMSGLELIQKASELNAGAQFIILSGYSDFEYAKQAMEYGVRHYILKPCNEEQIIACIQKVTRTISEQVPFQALEAEKQRFAATMYHQLFINVIQDSLVLGTNAAGYGPIFEKFKKFTDFKNTRYELYALAGLRPQEIERAVQRLQAVRSQYAPSIFYSFVWVHHTLLLFFKSYKADYPVLESHIAALCDTPASPPRSERRSFPNLQALLCAVLDKITRFESIRYSDGSAVTTICNYKNLIQDIEKNAADSYARDEAVAEPAHRAVFEQLAAVTDVHLLKQLASSLLLLAASKSVSFTPLAATELLIGMEPLTDCAAITEMLLHRLVQVYTDYHAPHKTGEFSEVICNYVRTHIANPRLSLKWISENVLFMSEDYVSKKFFKETGEKFSNFVTGVRIQKAKELLAHSENDKIQSIAEQVGCGNNPQYFSQIFKKQTGQTPSGYIRLIRGA